MQYEQKVIPNFPDYSIDTNFIVTNNKTGKEPKSYLTPQGYVRLRVYKDGQEVNVSIHRLYMETFHPVEGMKNLVVNHKDGIRNNNVDSNLEWVTSGDNIRYGKVLNLSPTDRRVVVMNVFDDTEVYYESYLEAGRVMGKHQETIIFWLRFPNSYVYPGGWRVKRPDEEWVDIGEFSYDKIHYFNGDPVSVYNFYTCHEGIYLSQREVCILTGYSPSFISTQLNSGEQNVLPGMWVIKRRDDQWRTFGDPWLELERCTISRPIICRYPNGYEDIFESLTQCSMETDIGKTTILYRLDNNLLTPGRNGYAFEYYSDRVRRLSNQAL